MEGIETRAGALICKYDDWQIFRTENGFVMRCSNKPEKPVIEVFRFHAGEYDSKDYPSMNEIVTKQGIVYDISGELDDCSAYVFWKYVIALTPDSKPEFIGQIVDIFEDYLSEKEITLQNEDRDIAIEAGEYDDPDEAAMIYGDQYDVIGDAVSQMIDDHNLMDHTFSDENKETHQIDMIMSSFYDVLHNGLYGKMLTDEDIFMLKDRIKDTFANWGISHT